MKDCKRLTSMQKHPAVGHAGVSAKDECVLGRSGSILQSCCCLSQDTEMQKKWGNHSLHRRGVGRTTAEGQSALLPDSKEAESRQPWECLEMKINSQQMTRLTGIWMLRRGPTLNP